MPNLSASACAFGVTLRGKNVSDVSPSARGRSPRTWSNVRFSRMTYTTCRNGGIVVGGGAWSQRFAAATRRDSAGRSWSDGAARAPSVPLVWPSVYCMGSRGSLRPGCDRPGFGPVPAPLPFSTHSDDPRASTAVGYHWAGMRPRSAGRAAADDAEAIPPTSKTATALLSASAT